MIVAAQRVFDAMEALDEEALRNSMVPEGFLLSVSSGATRRTTRDQFAERIASRTTPIIERIWDPEVRIDGPVATLWAAYDLYNGDEFSHCGTDAFQLVETVGGWKVVVLSFTSHAPPSGHPERVERADVMSAAAKVCGAQSTQRLFSSWAITYSALAS